MATLRVPQIVPSPSEDIQQLRKAFVGLGTNEKTIISILAHRNAAQRRRIRETYHETYGEDLFVSLKKEISGDFERVVILWTLDQAERDAMLVNEAVNKWHPGNLALVEIACARSAGELFATRKAYQARYKRSLEEDVAAHTKGDFRKLLVPLVSSYRYEGPEVNTKLAKLEAKTLHKAITEKSYSHEEIIRILGTRSKTQLIATFNHYNNEFGNPINKMDRGDGRRGGRQGKGHHAPSDATVGAVPAGLCPAIAGLRGLHRAAHPDQASILDPLTHLLMVREWPITCPRFIEMLQNIGLDTIRHLQYIRLDHQLITAFVERWSYQTNTFHLPVGEMTVTLQDVGVILGVRVDGMALVGGNVVGHGRRWSTWPDCCDELIGTHPDPDAVYHHPEHPEITASFRMGQAATSTCLPLRWLRWTYYRASYIDLDDVSFSQHVRAYVLFIMGCFLIPDTSGAEIHLQYLPLLEDLDAFAGYSLGGAVLAQLYRELKEGTRPGRTYIACCMQLLQVWIWEHFHIGRPTLHIPTPRALQGKSVGFRWNENQLRETRPSILAVYRDHIDGLLDSQVIWEPYSIEIMLQISHICTAGVDIWHSRVPVICWRRVEWHLADRVMRQFGISQGIDMEPMQSDFKRVDGRGRADVDWLRYHRLHIQLWDRRRELVVAPDDDQVDRDTSLRRYLRWYRSWATLYLLQAPKEPPTTDYPKAPGERILRHYLLQSEDIFKPFFGSDEDSPRQHAINKMEDLCGSIRHSMHITDDRCESGSPEHTPIFPDPLVSAYQSGEAGPSSQADPGPSTYYAPYSSYPVSQNAPFMASQSQGGTPYGFGYSGQYYGDPFWIPPQFTQQIPDGSGPSQFVMQPDAADQPEEQHDLRDRPRRPPAHYTPGSDAIPRKHRRR